MALAAASAYLCCIILGGGQSVVRRQRDRVPAWQPAAPHRLLEEGPEAPWRRHRRRAGHLV